jgi:predicted acyltransferase
MAAPSLSTRSERIASVDAYRGFVMFLMMAEVLRLGRVAKELPDSSFWGFLAFHQSHVPWTGCSLHDLIQPSFSFLVGVALPFSLMSRQHRGATTQSIWFHTIKRSVILVALGIFLRSMHSTQTNFTFEDTLSQIGLGYPFLFALGLARPRVQVGALVVILLGYWMFFALYPLPGQDFDWSQAGVLANWEHNLDGFAAHWNKNTNAAWAFDQWFMNLFPREKPFLFNGGGYSTLSFIPTLGTMILGLLAGGWIKERSPDLLKKMLITGASLLVLAMALSWLGINPIVKRIWTPSWVLFSGGWCFLFLAGFYYLADIRNIRRPFYFLLVVGANSIAAYVLAEVLPGFIEDSFKIHFGASYADWFGVTYQPLISGGLKLLILWLILNWMYRKKIFIKI